MKKSKKRSTRMNTGRKRGPSKAKLDRMASFRNGWAARDVLAKKQLARLRKKLREMKTPAPGTFIPVDSEFLEGMGKLYRSMDVQFAVDKKVDWWWRVPYGWWLTLKKCYSPRRFWR